MIPQLLMGGVGVAQAVMNQQQRNKTKRIQEAKVARMEDENDVNRERLENISPEAAYQAQMSALNDAQSSAESAALNTSANSAVSGSGDVGGANIGATKAAMAAHGAAAPLAQAKAGAASDMVQAQLGKGQAIDNNIMQGAQIGDMVNYNEQDNHLDVVNALSGGASVMENILGFRSTAAGSEQKNEPPPPVPTTKQVVKSVNATTGKGQYAAAGNIPKVIPPASIPMPDMGSIDFTKGIPKAPYPPTSNLNQLPQANIKGVPFAPQHQTKVKIPQRYTNDVLKYLNPGGIF